MFSFTPAVSGRQEMPNFPSSSSHQKEGERKEGESNNNKVTLEELFNYGRVKTDAPLLHKILFLFYLPLGFIVLVTRVILFLILCFSILLLPRKIGDVINMPLMKVVCGLVVRHNNTNRNKPLLDEPHIIALNHVADFDTFAMWVAFPKYHTLTAANLKNVPFVGSVYAKLNAIFVTPTPEGRAEVKAKVVEIVKNDSAPIAIFPEGGLTNGRKGTMMYHRFVFSLDTAIIPVAISLNDPWPVYNDYLGSTWARNFLWFLLVPFHFFEITVLPAEKRKEGESAEEFAGRVQKITSDYLNIESTNYSYSQKKGLWAEISSKKKNL